MNISKFLYEKIYIYLNSIEIKIEKEIKVSKCKNINFGHYQISGFKSIFIKFNKLNKNKILNEIKYLIKNIEFVYKIEIIDFNFINIFLKKEWIENKLKNMLTSYKFNILFSSENKKTIIIDYSSPNLAKEMHIGHLRSTIIGDSLSRILEFIENNVIRINHVGDWGINFGIIIAKIKKLEEKNNFNYKNLSINEIEKLYKYSKFEYNSNLEFYNFAQECLYNLQSKNKEHIEIWKYITNLSIKNNEKIYKILNIKLNNKNIIGESFYNDKLPYIVNDLKLKNIAIENEGLVLIPLKEFKNRRGEIMNVIIKKKNETYLYSAIEIASIKYRFDFFKADKIIYCVDNRQYNHLIQSFLISKMANYIPENSLLQHYSFGIIFNKFNKPYKTRDGNTIKLIKLINESIINSKNFILKKKNKNLSKSKLNKLSKIIGISSLKYFDLSKNRKNNYNLDLNKIISLEKNTAIYIHYSYVRILSILKKYGIKNLSNIKYLEKGLIYIEDNEELRLSLILIYFEEIIFTTADLGMPNILCEYLYELILIFSKFYEKNNILNINTKKIKISKLNLCILIARIIKKCLELLGIKTIENI